MQVISDALKTELDTILRSFLQDNKKSGTLFISRYDIPHIVEVIGQRVTREMVTSEPETERLRAALRRIANPVGYLEEYAKEQGHDLNGAMAIQISNDPYWLKREASKALSDGASP